MAARLYLSNGIQAMVDEHFGVAVAELQRAGCTTLRHYSGGRRLVGLRREQADRGFPPIGLGVRPATNSEFTSDPCARMRAMVADGFGKQNLRYSQRSPGSAPE